MAVVPTDLTRRMPLSIGLGTLPEALVADLLRRASHPTGRTPLDEIDRWLERPPPYAENFLKADTITLAGGASRTVVGQCIFRVPSAAFGVLRFFANSVGGASDAPFVRFALEVDEVPLTGFANIIGPVCPGLTSPLPLMKGLLPNQRVRVVATNLSASSIQNVAGLIRGWYWASTLQAQRT